MSDFDEIDITDEDADLNICDLFSADCCGDDLCCLFQQNVAEFENDVIWDVISENAE